MELLDVDQNGDSNQWSRRFRVEDFSLKEPFESWYHGRVWNGSLLLTEEGSVFVGTNQRQDSE